MGGKIVIAAYRAKPGNLQALLDIIKLKRRFMLAAGYYTSREPIMMNSSADNNLIIEVFEWAGMKAIEEAHANPEVHKIWDKMYEICEEVGSTLRSFPEAGVTFPLFEPQN